MILLSFVPQTLILGNRVCNIAYIELFQRNSIIIVCHYVLTCVRVNYFKRDYETLITRKRYSVGLADSAARGIVAS